ncbi:hypothetical protein SCUCBS95973_003472 [Sporothrix curviconia]|uniref:Zn(2)-C6 fungal-type domain-containing protein n=1 Tax=Sporothrix curviconia TaxID=1260050 RepID=A0ABP0BFP4_9PEZI
MSPAAANPAAPSSTVARPAASTPVTVPYSCLVCKQRKVRCNRQLPCSECVRTGVECVAVSRKPYAMRKRRRAPEDAAEFPERPRALAASAPSTANPLREQQERERPEVRGSQSMQRSQAMVFGQNLWAGLREDFCEPQPVETPATEERALPAAGSGTSLSTDPPAAFIFGLPATGDSFADLSRAHPQPVRAFMLWQTYLLSVNPLSKVIWAPQVQDLVIQATSSYGSLSAANVALLFSIYAAAVSSLPEEECLSKLGEPKHPLLAKYLACAQQALAAAGFMRSTSLMLLQAFAIFLLAARQSYDANTMWILTGMAVRMGQRLLATVPPPPAGAGSVDRNTTKPGKTDSASSPNFFETQMRLRLWWQIMLIDGRVTQLAGQARNFCVDTPDHPLPASLNDSDINPQMTGAPPSISDRPTEMVFCLLRYEMGKFLISKGSALHDPAATMAERDAIIDNVAAHFKEKYLDLLDRAIPLHQIARAGANAAILKMRLMAHHPGQYPDKGKSLPQTEHDMLFRTSVEMVGILVLGFTAMHIGPFRWHTDVYFQLDAVVFMLIESQTQDPFGEQVDEAWAHVASVLVHKPHLVREQDELGRAVRQLILRAWDSRERRARQLYPDKTPPAPPGHVADVLAELRQQKRVQQQQQQQQQQQKQKTTRGTTAQIEASQVGNEEQPQDIAGGETNEDTLVPTRGGSTAVESLVVPSMDASLTGFVPSLGIEYAAAVPSSLDASPFNDMDVLGWETTDWDSWGYWNTLLQGQSI